MGWLFQHAFKDINIINWKRMQQKFTKKYQLGCNKLSVTKIIKNSCFNIYNSTYYHLLLFKMFSLECFREDAAGH